MRASRGEDSRDGLSWRVKEVHGVDHLIRVLGLSDLLQRADPTITPSCPPEYYCLHGNVRCSSASPPLRSPLRAPGTQTEHWPILAQICSDVPLYDH